jgi:Zn-dependent peptidase ImmA (M78 family)/DNA-binding XRE family transcriptional regulator
MAARIEAFIKPELLVWARESAGYGLADAARKIGVAPEKLGSWEKGTTRPSIHQLQKVASAYKRPLAVFYLSEPPRTFDAMRDFRRLPLDGELRRSPSLLLEIRKAYQKREIAIEMSELLNEAPERFYIAADVNDEPENFSQKIRKAIGFTLEEQLRVKDRNEALRLWRESIERLGVLVFQTNSRSQISLGEMRGFSISEAPYPVIVLNSKDSPSGKIFTLLHEFVHILLHNGGLCDLEDYGDDSTEDQRIEFFCNMAAGALLVPGESLAGNSIVRSVGRTKIWTDEELLELSNLYSVSSEVILRRLLILGKTTTDFYKRKRSEYLKIEKKRTSGYAPFHRLVVRDNGPYYTKLVISAYQQEMITASDLSDYLGTKLKHLNDIEKDVAMVR